MKRTKFDEIHDQKVADEYLAAHRTCMICGHMTPNKVLEEYGRCWPCFDHYCKQAPGSDRRLNTQQRIELLQRMRSMVSAGPSAAVVRRNLLALAASGKRLTPSQQHVLECCTRHLEGKMPRESQDMMALVYSEKP
jgi:hypothetical protein